MLFLVRSIRREAYVERDVQWLSDEFFSQSPNPRELEHYIFDQHGSSQTQKPRLRGFLLLFFLERVVASE